MRDDPALRELPRAGDSGRDAASSAREQHGGANRGAANVVPAQERGALAPQAELRMVDILGEVAVTTAVRRRTAPPVPSCGCAPRACICGPHLCMRVPEVCTPHLAYCSLTW